MTRRGKVLIVVALLYAVTWIGGWRTHARDIAAEARRRYAEAQAQNFKYAAEDEGVAIELRDGGPQSGVDWCIPLLPGVLLVDSYYAVGPLYGKGTTKLILYYGFGSITLHGLWGWMA